MSMPSDDSATQWVRLENVRTLDDLNRLHPHDYAQAAARPVTSLDLLAERVAFMEALGELRDNVQRALDDLGRQMRG